jgi:23S rRNA (adenine2503-C2)-methyltransferase
VDGLPYQRPSWEKAAEIARTLHRRGILTKLRQSAGQDVDGGCGQLRARVLAPHRRGEVVPIQVVAQEAIGSAAPGRAGP